MVDYRITLTGDQRVTSTGDVRVTDSAGYVPAGAIITLSQEVRRENPASAFIVLSQSVKRYSTAGQLVLLEQGVHYNYELQQALVSISQETVRQVAAGSIVDLAQEVKRYEDAGFFVVLSQSVDYVPAVDWTVYAPVERQSIYLLDIDGFRLPISSVQATMKDEGQSYLEAQVPNAGEYADAIAGSFAKTMRLLAGYKYADGSFSQLETIAEAPLQSVRAAEGPTRHTATLSGYAPYTRTTAATRELKEIQTRTTESTGSVRVRCALDLILRPGHNVIYNGTSQLQSTSIQYFIGPNTEGMEVIGKVAASTVEITFFNDTWQDYLQGDWITGTQFVEGSDTNIHYIQSSDITDGQISQVELLQAPRNRRITVSYKVSSEAGYDFFVITVNDQEVFSDSGAKSDYWRTTTFEAEANAQVLFQYIKDGIVSELDDKAYIKSIEVEYL